MKIFSARQTIEHIHSVYIEAPNQETAERMFIGAMNGLLEAIETNKEVYFRLDEVQGGLTKHSPPCYLVPIFGMEGDQQVLKGVNFAPNPAFGKTEDK